MMKNSSVTFQFISEPTDVNFGGKVHGGVVMKWIDQVAYTCARTWSETYCVTVYVGGIRFLKPINIGDIIKVRAQIIHTGRTSMNIAVDVFGKAMTDSNFEKKTHCVIVFVSVDKDGKPTPVKKFIPENEKEKQLEQYAIKLKELRKDIALEMQPWLTDSDDV